MKKLLALLLFCIFATNAGAVSNDGHIVSLLFHDSITWECDYANNGIVAFDGVLEALNARGYVVIPAPMAIKWVKGEIDGSLLPAKPAVISFDDGPNQNWYDSTRCGGYLPSVRTVLERFKARHPELPSYSPNILLCVIASPVARTMLHMNGYRLSDEWWKLAQNHPLKIFTLCNHTADHNNTPTILARYWDPDLEIELPVAALSDRIWNNPVPDIKRINTVRAVDAWIGSAGEFIGRQAGTPPTIVAYPFGHWSSFIDKQIRDPRYGIDGAFCTTAGVITRASNPYCLERYTHVANWDTPERFLQLLGEPINAPSVRGMSPSTMNAGQSGVTLHLLGENFVKGSKIVVIASPQYGTGEFQAEFNHQGDISLTISGTLAPGSYVLYVRNPDGISSPNATLEVSPAH